MGIQAELSEAVIVLYKHDDLSMHYVAGLGNTGGVGGSFRFYNAEPDVAKSSERLSIWKFNDKLNVKKIYAYHANRSIREKRMVVI